jgi:fibronectin-binding autotransporter adhesin
MTLTGSSTYTGTTDVSNLNGISTLTVTNATGLGNSSGVTVDPGTELDINGVTLMGPSLITLNNSTLSGTGTSGVSIPLALTVGSADTIVSHTSGSTFTINGNLNGAADVTLNGPGNISLLSIGNTSPLSSLTANTPVTIGGSTVSTTGTQLYNSSITLNTNPTAFTGSVMTFNGAIGGVGGINLNGGTMILANSGNNYSGSTSITNGTLQLGADNAVPTATNLVVTLGSNFDLSTFDQTLGSLAGAGDVLLGTGTITTQNNNSTTFSGNMSGNGSFTKNGTGTTILSGTNSYLGTTTVNGGVLSIASAQGLSPSSVVTVNNAALDINNVSPTTAGISLNNSTLSSQGVVNLATTNINFVSGTTDALTSSAGSVFTVTGDLNGAVDLALSGIASTLNINGNVGNLSPLKSLSTVGNVAISGNVSTLNNQVYNTDINLANDATYTSTNGAVTFNGLLNGANNLVVTSGGVTTFAGAVGGSTPLSSLTVNASNVDINGGSVTTTGAQNYNEPVTLGGPTALSGSTVNMTHGVNGNAALTINGNNVNIAGVLALSSVDINGNGANNSFSLDSSPTQDWVINSLDSGDINSVSGVTGQFSFANMQNLNGGTGADSFTLAGGTVTGNLNGGSGINTLTGNNLANTFNLTSLDSGTLTGIGGTFANMQNLIGGSGDDVFMINGGGSSGFINGGSGMNTLMGDSHATVWNISGVNSGNTTDAISFNNIQNLLGSTAGNTFKFGSAGRITGSINGGNNPTADNVLSWISYGGPITVKLSKNKFDGTASDANGIVANYTNINFIIGNPAFKNHLLLTTEQFGLLQRTGKFSGVLGDPLTFTNFFVPNPSTGAVDSQIAQLIFQGLLSDPYLIVVNGDVENNVRNINDQFEIITSTDLYSVHINPNCSAGGGM